jgi:hypothetical protein
MVIVRRVASFCVALLLLSTAAQAGTLTVFGPRDYTRTAGQPQTVRETFTVRNPSAPYTLRLVNGGAAATFGRVTSAVVKINGVEIFGSRDFNGNTPAMMEKPLTLTATNEITVEVRGAPGSGLTISILGVDSEGPAIAATVTPAPNANGWNNDLVTVTFQCTDALTGVTSCSAPVTLTNEGLHSITGSATDSAGNTSTRAVAVKIDKTGAIITINSPANASAVAANEIEITGTVTDPLSGVASVLCGTQPAALSGSTFTCTMALADGLNAFSVRATDNADVGSATGVTVRSDRTAPLISIESPRPGVRTNVAEIDFTGSVQDDHEVAELKIGATVVPVTNGRFTAAVPLAKGANGIVLTATDTVGNVRSATLQVTRYALPEIAITSPADLATVRDAAITVTGSVRDAATVTVNGIAASISGETFTASGIPLAQGRTVITATAASDDGAVASASVFAYRDGIPPRIVIRAPLDGALLFAPTVNVSGMIDDIVVGTVNSTQATVSVNGIAAEVANRAFVARNVPLAAGANVIRVTATDQGGNSSTVTANVTYDAAARAKISLVSGNNQTAVIGNDLPQPLVVRLVNADGTPAASSPVVFEVVENNGVLAADGIGGQSVATTTTDASGTARATLVAGAHAGAGNNRVRASAAGFAGAVEFQATGKLDVPVLIVVDAGNAQFGAFGAPLPRPIVVAVVDSGSNRVPNVPVAFTVAEGTGNIDGAQRVVVNTDSDGRAWVTPTLGQDSRNTFLASIPGVEAQAAFQAFGKLAGPAGETRLSGVILDNTDLPIPGVSVRVDGTTLVTQADDAGQFTIAGAPVGYVKLLVDGSTARRPGVWPTLEYAMFTIPGANNTLEMPIFLLPIDNTRGLFVDEVSGGVLTLPELPGFSLTIKPGSATFPGGGRTGTVSVTMVHADKMPMAPGFGQQPRFIVTIQPPGVHFDPPAAISFPNVDGYAPGEVTEMYSFDHDLGQFVSIGTASVSQDGTILRSDPGVGIIKGGWHCGGNPPPGGTPHCCPRCKSCQGNVCLPFTGDDDQSTAPEDQCCGGKAFKTTTNCCNTAHQVVSKQFTHLSDCPNPVAKPPCPGVPDPIPGCGVAMVQNPPTPCFTARSNGCSIPPWLPFDHNDPLGGGADTTFSNCAGAGNRPCDIHDVCYQRCNPTGRKACDDVALAHMYSLCSTYPPPGTTPVPSVGPRCSWIPNSVYTVLRIAGSFAFDSNQKKSCLCC